ncbi:MAG: hypothetical protein HYY06_32410 [Deltaproteobacteria bacterium]|nr:hypothetical protein [Deltaproteobacteria bacterium]
MWDLENRLVELQLPTGVLRRMGYDATDALGSVYTIADDHARSRTHRDYDAFGEIDRETGDLPPGPIPTSPFRR